MSRSELGAGLVGDEERRTIEEEEKGGVEVGDVVRDKSQHYVFDLGCCHRWAAMMSKSNVGGESRSDLEGAAMTPRGGQSVACCWVCWR